MVKFSWAHFFIFYFYHLFIIIFIYSLFIYLFFVCENRILVGDTWETLQCFIITHEEIKSNLSLPFSIFCFVLYIWRNYFRLFGWCSFAGVVGGMQWKRINMDYLTKATITEHSHPKALDTNWMTQNHITKLNANKNRIKHSKEAMQQNPPHGMREGVSF